MTFMFFLRFKPLGDEIVCQLYGNGITREEFHLERDLMATMVMSQYVFDDFKLSIVGDVPNTKVDDEGWMWVWK